jgi:hypothetical protein
LNFVKNGDGDPPDEFEICPGCAKLVEWVAWEQVSMALEDTQRDAEEPEEDDEEEDKPACEEHNWRAVHGTDALWVCSDCRQHVVLTPSECTKHSKKHDWVYSLDGTSRKCAACQEEQLCNTLYLPDEGVSDKLLAGYNRGELELPTYLVRQRGGTPR